MNTVQEVSKVEAASIAQIYAPWILAIVVLVLLVLLGLVGYFFLARRARDMEGLGRALIVYVFALIVAVFTSFLAVVVTVGPASPSEFKFSWSTLSITLIGPPAVWAAASWFMTRSSIITALERDRYADVERRILEAERRLNWEDYYAWKVRVGTFKKVIGDIEVYFIEDLLPKVYYHGQPEYHRMGHPAISTLFIYCESGIVKLQRIHGKYDHAEGRPHIYLPSTSSTPTGQLRSVHCVREDGRITEVGAHRHGEWKATSTDEIDYLICTLYDNDEMPSGDYLYVDTTKYLKRDGLERAKISICIVANRKAKNLHTWELRASSAGAHLPVPLIFRELRKRPLEGEKAVDVIQAEFGTWIDHLQKYTKDELDESDRDTNGVRHFMDALWGILGAGADGSNSIADVVRQPAFVERRALADLSVGSVLITTFEWTALPRKQRGDGSVSGSSTDKVATT